MNMCGREKWSISRKDKMKKYRIIGNMTGNSMDAIDLVLTEFYGGKMSDICTFSKPYNKDMQAKMEALREMVFDKTAAEILLLPEFKAVHDEYICQIAECVNEMCFAHNIDKRKIDAIGFHGKTLDHNPPSKAAKNGTLPYTLQIGSGKMLADLTDIPVVYDFRSDFIFHNMEGAPLVPFHNAHIAKSESDGCYYNGGNTSNFAIIKNGKVAFGTDAGPFNEYVDGYVRKHTDLSFDENAAIGSGGKLNAELLQKLYDFGRIYYETPLPKSGDPAYYHKPQIFAYAEQSGLPLADIIHTFEYFAAYIAVQALSPLPEDIDVSSQFILFGGGWKNPLVKQSFADLLNGRGYILPEHQRAFLTLWQKFRQPPQIKNSALSDYMEARLLADLAYYKLQNKAWETPETLRQKIKIVCGIAAYPDKNRVFYDDMINRAAKPNKQA